MTENDKRVTIVSPIDWKKSFSSHPFIIVNSVQPIEYRIACKELSDDGRCLTIFPSLNGSIDEMLEVLEGCLAENSNFRTVLEEYYGKKIQNMTRIKCVFNGIKVTITRMMTAEEAKLNWLRDGLKSGYKGMVTRLTLHEKAELEREPGMKELISKYKEEM